MSRVESSSAASNPAEYYYYFNGVQVGDVSNNGPATTDYVTSMALHGVTPSSTNAFESGNSATPVAFADFSQGFSPISDARSGAASSYTVAAGDTLRSIAQAIWGDANLWYVLAAANGMSANQTLVGGQLLTIPANVSTSSQSSATFKVYDPSKAIGNVQPTTPAPPPPPATHSSGGGCGGIGAILVAIVAVVVTAIVQPELISVATQAFGAQVATAGATLTATQVAGVVAGDALAGAVGSIASQTFGVATGIQSNFDWSAVALAAIGNGVGGAVSNIPGLQINLGNTAFSPGVNAALNAGANAAETNVLSQGIGVATGLQQKFDWTSVAVAGVGAAVTSYASANLPGAGLKGAAKLSFTGIANTALSGVAGSIAGAATRSLLTGTDFGDNIVADLPGLISNTVGNLVASGLQQANLPQTVSPNAGAVDTSAYNLQLAPNTLGDVSNLSNDIPQVSYPSDQGASALGVTDAVAGGPGDPTSQGAYSYGGAAGGAPSLAGMSAVTDLGGATSGVTQGAYTVLKPDLTVLGVPAVVGFEGTVDTVTVTGRRLPSAQLASTPSFDGSELSQPPDVTMAQLPPALQVILGVGEAVDQTIGGAFGAVGGLVSGGWQAVTHPGQTLSGLAMFAKTSYGNFANGAQTFFANPRSSIWNAGIGAVTGIKASVQTYAGSLQTAYNNGTIWYQGGVLAGNVALIYASAGIGEAGVAARSTLLTAPLEAAETAAGGYVPASSLQADLLGQQLAAEEAAGASAPTKISSWSDHVMDQIAGRDGGLGVSQNALEDAFNNPNTIEYAPSKYGPTFRFTGQNATVVVNPQGNVVTGWAINRGGLP